MRNPPGNPEAPIRQKTLAYGEKTLTVEHLCGALGGAHK